MSSIKDNKVARKDFQRRLEWIVNACFEGNVAKFGRAIGKDQSQARRYVTGAVFPRPSVFQHLKNAGISFDWLTAGLGKPFLNNENGNLLKTIAINSGIKLPELPQHDAMFSRKGEAQEERSPYNVAVNRGTFFEYDLHDDEDDEWTIEDPETLEELKQEIIDLRKAWRLNPEPDLSLKDVPVFNQINLKTFVGQPGRIAYNRYSFMFRSWLNLSGIFINTVVVKMQGGIVSLGIQKTDLLIVTLSSYCRTEDIVVVEVKNEENWLIGVYKNNDENGPYIYVPPMNYDSFIMEEKNIRENFLIRGVVLRWIRSAPNDDQYFA